MGEISAVNPSKQFELSSLSEDEKNARLAAANTSYGMGTRSFNRSAEKKEIDRQRAETTARYHAGELKVGQREWGPICTCRSFNLPHELKRHRELKSERDWSLESERRVQYFDEGVR